jgi:hypothetical protein
MTPQWARRSLVWRGRPTFPLGRWLGSVRSIEGPALVRSLHLNRCDDNAGMTSEYQISPRRLIKMRQEFAWRHQKQKSKAKDRPSVGSVLTIARFGSSVRIGPF